MLQPLAPAPTSAPAAGAAYLVLQLEEALARRQAAVLEVERLVVDPSGPDALAEARRRLEALSDASAGLLERLERAAGLRRPPARVS